MSYRATLLKSILDTILAELDSMGIAAAVYHIGTTIIPGNETYDIKMVFKTVDEMNLFRVSTNGVPKPNRVHSSYNINLIYEVE